MKEVRYLLVLLALALVLPQVALAATEKTDLYQLEQITVFGEDRNEMVRTASVNNIVYDEETINATIGDTLADLLQQQGVGILPSANADGTTFLVMRGFRSDHLGKELDGRTLILIDGRRSSASDPTMISLLNVERVEILRGAEMLQYSGSAAGGVINVVTKRPTGGVPMSATFEAGLGSFGYKKGKVAANGAIDGFDYSLGYQFSNIDDYSDANGDRVKYSSNKGINSFAGNLGYTFLENHRFGVLTNVYYANHSEKPADIDKFEGYKEANYSDKMNYFVNFNYEGTTTDRNLTWDASYSFGQDYVKNYQAANNNGLPPMAHWYDTQTAQARTTYHNDLFDITGGVQWYQYVVDVQERKLGSQRIDSSTTSNYAGYVMGRLKLWDQRLIFSAGARYDYYEVTDDGRANRSQQTKKSTNWDGLSPSIGVAVLPLDWLKLRANYTQGIRVPSGRELVEDKLYNYWGNPNLQKEVSDTYEAGFDFIFDYAQLSLTYFYINTKDYIYQHSLPTDNNGSIINHARVQNADKQIRNGLELQLNGDVAKFIGWGDFEIRPFFALNYIFKKEEQFRGGQPWTEIEMIPKYTYAAGLYFKYLPWDFWANLDVTHIGEVLAMQSSAAAPKDRGHYTLVNLSMQKKLFGFNEYGALSLRLDIKNMFNESYRPVTGSALYDMPGRSFYVGAIYNF